MLPRGFPREAGDPYQDPQNKMQCSTSARCHLKPKNPMSPSRSSRLRVRLYPHLHMWQLAFHLMHRNLQNKVLRCTSGFLAPHHSSPIQPETEPPGRFLCSAGDAFQHPVWRLEPVRFPPASAHPPRCPRRPGFFPRHRHIMPRYREQSPASCIWSG